jgi:translation initiation factor 3 subunit E
MYFCPVRLKYVPTAAQNMIEINRPALPVYQSVIERTRGLALRTQALGAAISRSGQSQSQRQQQPPQQGGSEAQLEGQVPIIVN